MTYGKLVEVCAEIEVQVEDALKDPRSLTGTVPRRRAAYRAITGKGVPDVPLKDEQALLADCLLAFQAELDAEIARSRKVTVNSVKLGLIKKGDEGALTQDLTLMGIEAWAFAMTMRVGDLLTFLTLSATAAVEREADRAVKEWYSG